MSDDRIRWSMSLRQRDGKLTEYFAAVGEGDRSAECRRLMYLGLDLIEMLTNGTISADDLPSPDPTKFLIVTKQDSATAGKDKADTKKASSDQGKPQARSPRKPTVKQQEQAKKKLEGKLDKLI